MRLATPHWQLLPFGITAVMHGYDVFLRWRIIL